MFESYTVSELKEIAGLFGIVPDNKRKKSAWLECVERYAPTQYEIAQARALKSDRVFIAPGAGRKLNAYHFLGYLPGGVGGGVNVKAFNDFSRQTATAECLVRPKNEVYSEWALSNQAA